MIIMSHSIPSFGRVEQRFASVHHFSFIARGKGPSGPLFKALGSISVLTSRVASCYAQILLGP